MQIAYGSDVFDIDAPNGTRVRLEKYRGFEIFPMVNLFIKNHKSFRSITLIDTDLIMPDDYFFKISRAHNVYKNVPLAIQGYSTFTDTLCEGIIQGCIYNYVKNVKYGGHTGLIWSFSKSFIDKIGKFPEEFIYGGFDYVLYLCLVRRLDILKDLIKNDKYQKIILDFYKMIEGTKINYLPAKVIHNYHGDTKKRINQWDYYTRDTDEVLEHLTKRDLL